MTDWLITHSTLIDESGQPRKNAQSLLSNIRLRNENYLILTEETRRSADQLADHMLSLGFRDVRAEDFYSSLHSSIDWIARTCPEKNRCSYIGTNAMRTVLEQAGFMIDRSEENWVFIGCNRTVSLKDCSYELSLLQKGAELICLQDDALDPEDPGSIGPGSICCMLENACGRKALHFGYPQESFLKNAIKVLNADPMDTMLIGRNLKREILPGIHMGLKTIYVTSGIGFEDEFDANEHPTYFVTDVGGIFR